MVKTLPHSTLRCVYCTLCIPNRRRYIGQTSGMASTRFRCHHYVLQRHMHPNVDLQEDWDLFGLVVQQLALRFRVITIIKPDISVRPEAISVLLPRVRLEVLP